MPGSRSSSLISAVQSQSNVGEPGKFVFGLTPDVYDNEQCFLDISSLETTSVSYETSSVSSVPSASWVPCKEYSSSYSSSWDEQMDLYDYGPSFNDTVACPIDDDSFDAVNLGSDGILIGLERYTKIFVSVFGLWYTVAGNYLNLQN